MVQQSTTMATNYV